MELEKMELLSNLLPNQKLVNLPETNLDNFRRMILNISYIVMMDEEFGIVANPTDIKN